MSNKSTNANTGACCIAAAWLALTAPVAWAQTPGAPLDERVQAYVAEGLRTNLALQSETLQVERAAASLAAARARF